MTNLDRAWIYVLVCATANGTEGLNSSGIVLLVVAMLAFLASLDPSGRRR